MTTNTMSPKVEQRFRANAASARRPLVDNLLTESEGFTQMTVLEEDTKARGALIVEGLVGICGKATKNRRLYTEAIMRREIKRLQERIDSRSLLAAVDHPTDGKCLGRGTPVLLADGRVLPVEEVVTGDRLMGPDGKPRTVLTTTVGKGALYRIDPNKGEPWVCNDAHMLTLSHTSTHELIDISVEEWVKKGAFFQSRYKLTNAGVESFDNDLASPSIDPYFLGAWFGDGSKSVRTSSDGESEIPSVAVTTIDPEIKQVCEDIAERWEASLTECGKATTEAKTIYLTTERGQDNRLLRTMRDLVGPERRIPDSVIRGSRETRLQFLAGLLDTDGTLKNNLFYITQKREDYIRDAYRIARSLGFQAQLSTREVKGYGGIYHRLSIWGDVDQIPTKLPRKQAAPRDTRCFANHTGFTVTDIGEGDYYGFEIDGDGRFLLGDFTVTHNSRIREAGAICVGLRVEANGRVIGKYEIVEDSDGGRNLAAFLRAGASIGMSSRGLGSTSVNMEGVHVVGEDFKLHGFDFVADPACETAYPTLVSEDVDAAQVDENQLRATFGSLIEQIEDRARIVGAEIAEDDVRKNVEEEFKQALDEAGKTLREDIRLQLEAEVREQLREDFSVKLLKALNEQRAAVEAVVRSEMLSDPKVAGAKRFVEDLAQKLVPYQPTPDQQVVMDDYEGKLAGLREDVEKNEAAVSAKDSVINELTERVSFAEKSARQLGYKLYVERAIAGRPNAESLREMIGEPEGTETPDELREKITAVLNSVTEAEDAANEQANARLKVKEHKADIARKKVQVVTEEFDSFRNEMESKFDTLSRRMNAQVREKDAALAEALGHIENLENEVSRTRTRAEEADLRAYTARRVVGHPRAGDILSAVDAGRITSKDQVRQLAEQWDQAATEPGGVSERIRRTLGRGREAPTEGDQERFSQLMEDHNPIPGLEDFGTTMGELRALSGIDSDFNNVRRF